MPKKIFFNLILILFNFLIFYAFSPALPLPFSHLNFILVALIFVLVLSGFEIAFLWALVLGVLADFFSFGFFGFYLSIFVLTLIFLNFLFKNFFTNSSLYSFLALGFFGSLAYDFLLIFNLYFFKLIRGGNLFFLKDYIFQREFSHLFLNFLLIIILFYLFNRVRGLKPVFLIR